MIRFIRALIYGAFAAFAAMLLLDWLDRDLNDSSRTQRLDSVPGPKSSSPDDAINDDAKQALLDELSAQV